ncbi:MAG: hypothetical protein AAF570_04665 [Bacteroidota bacterium]
MDALRNYGTMTSEDQAALNQHISDLTGGKHVDVRAYVGTHFSEYSIEMKRVDMLLEGNIDAADAYGMAEFMREIPGMAIPEGDIEQMERIIQMRKEEAIASLGPNPTQSEIDAAVSFSMRNLSNSFQTLELGDGSIVDTMLEIDMDGHIHGINPNQDLIVAMLTGDELGESAARMHLATEGFFNNDETAVREILGEQFEMAEEQYLNAAMEDARMDSYRRGKPFDEGEFMANFVFDELAVQQLADSNMNALMERFHSEYGTYWDGEAFADLEGNVSSLYKAISSTWSIQDQRLNAHLLNQNGDLSREQMLEYGVRVFGDNVEYIQMAFEGLSREETIELVRLMADNPHMTDAQAERYINQRVRGNNEDAVEEAMFGTMESQEDFEAFINMVLENQTDGLGANIFGQGDMAVLMDQAAQTQEAVNALFSETDPELFMNMDAENAAYLELQLASLLQSSVNHQAALDQGTDIAAQVVAVGATILMTVLTSGGGAVASTAAYGALVRVLGTNAARAIAVSVGANVAANGTVYFLNHGDIDGSIVMTDTMMMAVDTVAEVFTGHFVDFQSLGFVQDMLQSPRNLERLAAAGLSQFGNELVENLPGLLAGVAMDPTVFNNEDAAMFFLEGIIQGYSEDFLKTMAISVGTMPLSRMASYLRGAKPGDPLPPEVVDSYLNGNASLDPENVASILTYGDLTDAQADLVLTKFENQGYEIDSYFVNRILEDSDSLSPATLDLLMSSGVTMDAGTANLMLEKAESFTPDQAMAVLNNFAGARIQVDADVIDQLMRGMDEIPPELAQVMVNKSTSLSVDAVDLIMANEANHSSALLVDLVQSAETLSAHHLDTILNFDPQILAFNSEKVAQIADRLSPELTEILLQNPGQLTTEFLENIAAKSTSLPFQHIETMMNSGMATPSMIENVLKNWGLPGYMVNELKDSPDTFLYNMEIIEAFRGNLGTAMTKYLAQEMFQTDPGALQARAAYDAEITFWESEGLTPQAAAILRQYNQDHFYPDLDVGEVVDKLSDGYMYDQDTKTFVDPDEVPDGNFMDYDYDDGPFYEDSPDSDDRDNDDTPRNPNTIDRPPNSGPIMM